jgi:hypothetical protein
VRVMKRALLAVTVFGAAAVLGGCPVYSSSSNYRVCNSSGCFDCPDPSYSGMCIPWTCNTDSDCGDGYSCSGSGECVAGSGTPSPTDCGSPPGCQAGFVCKLSGGSAQCVPAPAEEDASSGEIDAGPGEDAFLTLDASLVEASFPPMDAGAVSEAATGVVEAAAPAIPCNASGDCAVGSQCIDGACTVQGQLCSDATQCVVAGESCVNGICLPTCSASAPCPTGYACNLTLGVCDINPGPCVGSGASSCQGGTVCVESHCVPPCSSAADAQSCPAGQVCANGGCIPDQRAQFDCKNDGESGLLANQCATSTICLHHDCYAACDSDGGGCGNLECKQVTVAAGTYAVCATSSTLGSDCDPAAGAGCPSGEVCMDGYCR